MLRPGQKGVLHYYANSETGKMGIDQGLAFWVLCHTGRWGNLSRGTMGWPAYRKFLLEFGIVIGAQVLYVLQKGLFADGSKNEESGS